MIRVFLVRHNISRGMVDYAERARYTDEAMPLAPRGLRERDITCEELKKHLNAHVPGPVTVVSSHFKRASQDAEWIVKALSHRKTKPPTYDPRLAEINKGDYWGMTKNAREKEFGPEAEDFYRKRKLEGKWYETPFRNGESPEHVYVERVEPFVRDYKKNFREGTLVVVSHDVTLRLLLGKLLRREPKLAEFEKPSGCGGIRLLEGETWNSLVDMGYVYKGVAPPARADHPEDLDPDATSAGGARSWAKSGERRGGRHGGR